MKTLIKDTILKIDQRIDHIKTATGIDEWYKREVINHLEQAKFALATAQQHISMAEQNFAFEF